MSQTPRPASPAKPTGHVKLGLVDLDGVMRGKYVSPDKFESARDKGFGFCDVVLGWDVNDELYDNAAFTGWHTGYPDAMARVVADTQRQLPGESDTPFYLCEFSGEAEALCPRGILRRVLQRAERLGYQVKAGFEYEFFVFDETPESAHQKQYRDLTPLSRGAFGYSVQRNCEHAGLYQALLQGCQQAGIPIEGLHEETGAGVLEAAIAVDHGLAAADHAAVLKLCVKTIALQYGKMATFMAKCNTDWPGQSGHIHVSLTARDNTPVFHSDDAEWNMSPLMRQFLAGQQNLMPELLGMVAPTINSYSRLVPGYWAPTSARWGVENRTGALRVIPGSASAQRIEYRVASADANPYLALAAAVGSGLWGMEQGWDPGEPVTGNAYEQAAPATLQLPATLWEAAQRLKQSTAARELFGDAFVDHFAGSREWEERQFRKHVTDWELRRYFEII